MGDHVSAAAAESRLLDDLPLASFEGLSDDMMCCVCQQYTDKNVVCCTNGHNACESCAERLTNGRCPMSCGPLTRVNGAFVRNIPLNSYIRETNLKCPHVEQGCTAACKIRDMRGHMRVCPFRTIRCPCNDAIDDEDDDAMARCEWRGPANAVREHFRDVDHSGYVISMLVKQKEAIDALSQGRVDELKERLAALERAASQQAARDAATDRDIARVHDQLETINGNTKKKDGTSERSRRRHREMSTKISTQAAEAVEAKKRITELEANLKAAEEARDGSINMQDLLKKTHAEELEIVTAQRTEAVQQRDRMERKRREEQDQADAVMTACKRHRDDALAASLKADRANRRLHELHAVVARMAPHATSRTCPCAMCRGED